MDEEGIMKFENIYKQVEGLEGWMCEADCEQLYNYAVKVKHGLIVEIGSYMGRSTITMAYASPTSKVIAIDPYLKDIPEYIMRKFLEESVGMNIELIRKKSFIVGKDWNRPIDLLHIDGDHGYESVGRDIELFVPHVKKGGVVLLHDYHAQDFGVKRAVDEVTGKYKVSILPGFAVIHK